MKHYVGAQMLARLTALERTLAAVQEEAAEEALHDLRVAARRYLQALRLFAEFLRPKRVRQMRGRLRRLMRYAGDVRNVDVTLQVLVDAGIENPATIDHLREEHTERSARLVRHLSRLHGRRAVGHWRKWLRPVEPKKKWSTAAVNAHARLPTMWEELVAAGVIAVAAGTEHELHRFRLLGKRFRYSLELFEDVYGLRATIMLRQLRSMQNHLGGINDCFMALQVIQGHADSERAVARLLQARREEFQRFWIGFHKRSGAWSKWLRG